MPSMRTVSSIRRIASTAAPSAASFSPRPTQRAAASAPYSVTRTSSMARLRSGREPVGSGTAAISEDAGWFPGARIARLAYEPAREDHVRADQPDYVAGLDRDADAVRASRPPEDDPVEQDQRAGN